MRQTEISEAASNPTLKSGSVRDFVTGKDDKRVLDLWNSVFPDPASGITPAWEFRDGPQGAQPRVVAEWGGKIAAHAGAMPMRFQLLGETVRGAYSVAAMTDADARGNGLYTRVAQHLYARLEREGFAFVAGFSNRRSVGIITGPLGRKPLHPFPWAVRPSAFSRKFPFIGKAKSAVADSCALGSFKVEAGGFGDPALDGLWKQVASHVRIGVIRDSQYNRWRFAGHPQGAYCMRWVRKGEQVLGYWIGRIMVFRGVRAAFLVDFLSDPNFPAVSELLLQDFRQWALGEKAWLLSALLPFHSFIRDSLRAFGFMQVPPWLHPHRLCFSVRLLGQTRDRSEIYESANWFLSWADTDIV
jgi:GNAT superfamily N-acetyltransferase